MAVLVLFVLLVQVRLWMPYWETHNVQAILTWDVMGYYLYLPAKFIYHDLGRLKFADDIMREYSPTGSFYQAFQIPGAPAGQLVMKYPIGLALLWTPFFWLGHWATRHWIFYSYGDQHFSFLRPHLWEVLFSFRKGWLIYSPLLALVLLGFGPLWRRHRGLAVPVLVYFVLNLWVVSAWDIWWYGGSLGCRALVPSYAVLALPWGAGVVWLLTPGRQRRWPIAAAAAAVLFVDLNLFQNWQYARSIIHPGDMNRAYYFAVFNKTMPTEADYAKLDEPHSGLPRAERYYHARSLGKLDFEQTPASTDNISAERAYSGRQSYFS